MRVITHKELIEMIRRYLQKKDEKPSSFGSRVLGDSGAVTRLVKGNDPRLSTVHRIVRAMRGEK